MKKCFLLLFVFAGLTITCYAQTDFKGIELQKDSDYASADKYALEASNYILSVPYDSGNEKRTEAVQFVLRWMQGTPDYSFAIDSFVMEEIVGEDEALLGIYMACMAKYCLENPGNAKDNELVKLNAVKLIIAYVEKKENNIKMSKSLKKLAEANRKGELEKALK